MSEVREHYQRGFLAGIKQASAEMAEAGGADAAEVEKEILAALAAQEAQAEEGGEAPPTEEELAAAAAANPEIAAAQQ